MKVRFLGTAAGGGLPQWNCACDGCARARREGTERTQDCLAVSGDGRAWYLVNASPDLRTQLLRTPELAPDPGSRDTPIRGVLLTSAELDHTLGLFLLREAGSLVVYATAPVHRALLAGTVLDRYTTVDRRTVVDGEPLQLDGGLTATAFTVGERRPRYAAGQPGADWVVGYRFVDVDGGGVLVYVPCLASWTPAVGSAVTDADVVVLDGTFFTSDEMARQTGLSRPAAGMGHLPIEETLPLLRAHRGPRYLFTHLNNTNPVAHSAAHRSLLAKSGADIAPEAGLINL